MSFDVDYNCMMGQNPGKFVKSIQKDELVIERFFVVAIIVLKIKPSAISFDVDYCCCFV